MAEMVSCKICGKIFESVFNNDVCNICKVKDDETYSKLREYLFLHPGSKIFDVSTELDIPILHIKRYLREDKLEIVERNSHFLTCVICGEPIRSGMHCDKCTSSAKNNEKAALTSTLSMRKEALEENSSRSLQKITYVKSNRGRRILSN